MCVPFIIKCVAVVIKNSNRPKNANLPKTLGQYNAVRAHSGGMKNIEMLLNVLNDSNKM